MSDLLRIGVAGVGTVGAGMIRILQDNAAMIAQRCGKQLLITHLAVRDAQKPRPVDLSAYQIVSDPSGLADAPVDIIVELMGGHEGAARALVTRALEKGIPVVTANKALIAHHGLALAQLAEQQRSVLAFEAAVAGGIPIIAALRSGLAANRIDRIAGILNGTCNYILTRMQQEQASFEQVLAEASRLGYLEADPALDIDGIDAGHKIAILAALAFGTQVNFTGVAMEGIRRVTLRDIHYAQDFGYRIKLLGIAERYGEALLQRVEPCLVAIATPLAAVDGAFNALEVVGDAVGRVVFEGRGAGAGPTGSAVVADLMAIARGDRYPPFTMPAAELKRAKPAAISQREGSYYVRLSLKDEPGVLTEFTREFAAQHISVKSIVQREIAEDGSAQVVVTTHRSNEAAMQKAIHAIGQLECSMAAPVMLRIYE